MKCFSFAAKGGEYVLLQWCRASRGSKSQIVTEGEDGVVQKSLGEAGGQSEPEERLVKDHMSQGCELNFKVSFTRRTWVVGKPPLPTAVGELTATCKTNNTWVGSLCFFILRLMLQMKSRRLRMKYRQYCYTMITVEAARPRLWDAAYRYVVLETQLWLKDQW